MALGLPDPISAPDVDSRQWSDAVSQTLMAARVVPGLRIPDAAGYLQDLARARIAALEGKDPEAALREVSMAWAARNKALGNQRQLWHYRRGLNSLATLPQPPEHGK
jgi:multiple sugar transport system substrate-binding protein